MDSDKNLLVNTELAKKRDELIANLLNVTVNFAAGYISDPSVYPLDEGRAELDFYRTNACDADLFAEIKRRIREKAASANATEQVETDNDYGLKTIFQVK